MAHVIEGAKKRLTAKAQRTRSAARELRGWREGKTYELRKQTARTRRAQARKSSSRDARSGSLQRMVRRCCLEVNAWSLAANETVRIGMKRGIHRLSGGLVGGRVLAGGWSNRKGHPAKEWRRWFWSAAALALNRDPKRGLAGSVGGGAGSVARARNYRLAGFRLASGA